MSPPNTPIIAPLILPPVMAQFRADRIPVEWLSVNGCLDIRFRVLCISAPEFREGTTQGARTAQATPGGKHARRPGHPRAPHRPRRSPSLLTKGGRVGG